jgi:pilus assembly protein CpaB
MTPMSTNEAEPAGSSSTSAAGATLREPPWGRTRWGRPRWGPVSRKRRWRRSHIARVVAVVLVALAAWVTAGGFLPQAGDPGVPTVVLARDLPLGTTLSSGDLRLERRPSDQRPTGAVDDMARAVGQVVSGPVQAGEIVTPARFRGAHQLAGLASGSVAVSLPVSDPMLLSSVRPADTVSVLAAGSGVPLAAAARVLATDVPGSGSFGSVGSVAGAPGHLVVAVTADESRALAVAMGPSGVPGGFLVAVRGGPG